MPIVTDEKTILDFLSGCGEDHMGRTYRETLTWTDADLEHCHDQVQWIFPLHEESRLAKTFPVITKSIVEKAKANQDIMENLRLAKQRFERFLGIGEYHNPNRHYWCREYDHNLLRITRIIRCLRLFGLNSEAKDFYKNVLKATKDSPVTPNTYLYWKMALQEDVWEPLQA